MHYRLLPPDHVPLGHPLASCRHAVFDNQGTHRAAFDNEDDAIEYISKREDGSACRGALTDLDAMEGSR